MRAVDLAVGVDSRPAPVGRDQVVQVELRIAPVPHRQHHVALDALRPRRLVFRQLAGRDAIGPVRPFGDRAIGAEARHHVDHRGHGLPGLNATGPGVARIGEVAELARDHARARRAHRMAREAAEALHVGEPMMLAALGRSDAVALRAGAGEFALRRNPQHRIPIDRRIELGRRALVRRDHSREVEVSSGLGIDLGRIDEPVPAYPHFEFCLRKIGDQVAALVVGDDDLGVFGRKVGGLRDHPDARLRPLRPGDDAADVVIVDGDGGGLSPGLRGHPGQRQKRNRRHAQHQTMSHGHGPLPWCLIFLGPRGQTPWEGSGGRLLAIVAANRAKVHRRFNDDGRIIPPGL